MMLGVVVVALLSHRATREGEVQQPTVLRLFISFASGNSFQGLNCWVKGVVLLLLREQSRDSSQPGSIKFVSCCYCCCRCCCYEGDG